MLSWTIGDVTVTRVVESRTTAIGELLLPEATPDVVTAIPWLAPDFLDETGKLIVNVHCFLVQSCGKRILVDACVGNDKPRPLPEWDQRSGPFLDDLARTGASRQTIDLAVCTHLHIDHVGWNTMLVEGQWVPTFANARYVFVRREWEHWKEQPEEFGPVITDSVRPIVEAGMADLVEPDHELTDEVRLEPTHGHTPGHVSVRIRSKGEEAVITGDLMHHPCQMARPEWSVALDYDQEQCRKARRELLEDCADRPVLLISSHFPSPTAGRVVRDGEGYRLQA